jgi:hypothetical protein
MSKSKHRWKWIGIAAVALVALVAIAYERDFRFTTPSARDARAALARGGGCRVDAPIERRTDGKVMIGDYVCDLEKQTFHGKRDGGLGKFEYSWNPTVTAPFGHWAANWWIMPVG